MVPDGLTSIGNNDLQILTHIVKRRLEMAPDIQQDTEAPLNFAVLATQTEGYSATDLQDFVARAVHQAAIKSAEKSVEGAEVKGLGLSNADATADIWRTDNSDCCRF